MVTFRVPDMTCGHCAGTITKALITIDEAARVEVDVPGKLVAVTSKAAHAELAEAIRKAGYTAQAAQSAPARQAAATGCCCASRKAAPVDADQHAAPTGSACCS